MSLSGRHVGFPNNTRYAPMSKQLRTLGENSLRKLFRHTCGLMGNRRADGVRLLEQIVKVNVYPNRLDPWLGVLRFLNFYVHWYSP
jgi:hypothetical protein